MHSHSIVVSVDIATWTPLWDWPLLNTTNVDKLMYVEIYLLIFRVMSTYAGASDTWKKYFDLSLSQISPEKLGVGLESVNPNNNQPLTKAELEFRFSNIMNAPVEEVDIWCSPLEDNWWEFLAKF